MKKALIGIGIALFVILIGVGIALATAGGSDNFVFLSGRRTIARGVLPLMADGNSPREGWTWQYRIYSFPEPFERVRPQMESELARAGYIDSSHPPGMSIWRRGDNAIYLQATHSRTASEAMNGERFDENWSTVIVTEPVDGSWLTHLRYALEQVD